MRFGKILALLLIAFIVQFFVRFEIATIWAEPGKPFYVTWLPFMDERLIRDDPHKITLKGD